VGQFPSNYTEHIPAAQVMDVVRTAARRVSTVPPVLNAPDRRLTTHKKPKAFLRASVAFDDPFSSVAVPASLTAAPGSVSPRAAADIDLDEKKAFSASAAAAADDAAGSGAAAEWTPPSVLCSVQALFDFDYVPSGVPEVDNLGYLTLRTGDQVHVVNQDDTEWWVGIHPNSHQVGFFPSAYVVTM